MPSRPNGLLLSGNTAIGNGVDGFEMRQSSGATFRGNSAIRNGVKGSSSERIQRKHLRQEPGHGQWDPGFFLNGASQNLLTGNVARDNGGGFDLRTSSQNTLRGNAATGNSGFGFYVAEGSNGNTLAVNQATANGFDGFSVNGSDANTLSMNRSEGNDNRGFNLIESSGLLLSGNAAIGNGWTGFEMHQSMSATLRGNSAIRNGQFGFLLGDASNGNTLDKNLATGNEGTGFFLDELEPEPLDGRRRPRERRRRVLPRERLAERASRQYQPGEQRRRVHLESYSTANLIQANVTNGNGGNGFDVYEGSVSNPFIVQRRFPQRRDRCGRRQRAWPEHMEGQPLRHHDLRLIARRGWKGRHGDAVPSDVPRTSVAR